MSDPPERLEARLAAVEQTLADVERRLRALELGAASPVDEAPPLLPWRVTAAVRPDLVGPLTLIGRTFLIFAGAYLLRALTEFGVFGLAAGVALASVYAAAWTVAAYRVAPRHPLSATFYGGTSVSIGLPLVWEATTRHAMLSPAAGAIALTALTAAVLLTAWRRDLHVLAWMATAAACLTATVLLVMTSAAIAFTVPLIALGIGTLWLGYDRGWTELRWVAALFADVTVLALVGRAIADPPRDAPSSVMRVQVLLLAGYLASIVIRTLLRGRDVILFEVVQTAVMLLVGLGGALLIAHQTGVGTIALGVSLLVFAVGCYAVEFIDRRQTRGANRYFYTSLALVFALTGADLVGGGERRGMLWLMCGLLTGWLAHHSGRITLAAHAVVYLTGAAISSGLMAATLVGLFASASTAAGPIGLTGWGVLLALGVYWANETRLRHSTPGLVAHLLRLGLATLVVLSVAGVSVVMARSLLIPGGGPPPAGIVATLRTGVLAAAALGVAWLGARIATREFGWLLYPILAWGAVKLMVEDFRTSPPLLLVVAFALYGGALILGPRIGAHPMPPTAPRE